MNAFSIALTYFAPRLGWMLIHSMWQAAVVAAILAGALRVMRQASSAHRYAAAFSALAVIVIGCAATFVLLGSDGNRIHNAVAQNVYPAGVRSIAPAEILEAMKNKTPPSIPRLQMVVQLWVVGVLAISLWHLLGWMWLNSLRIGKTIDGGERFASLASRMKVPSVVRLVETSRLDVPAVIGMLRPVILLPLGLLNELPSAQVEAIFAHELAHVRRHDYALNLVQSAVETLLFYHPAVWWISAVIRREREFCCDDRVASFVDVRTYASALLALERRRAPAGVLLLAANGGSLVQRVRRLLAVTPRPMNLRPARSIVVAIVCLVCVAIPIALFAQHPATTTSRPVAISSEKAKATPRMTYAMIGTLQRAGLYEFEGRKTTLKRAIILAGDLQKPEEPAFISVFGTSDGEHSVVRVMNAKYADLFSGRMQDVYLQPNDTVWVAEQPEQFPTTQAVSLPTNVLQQNVDEVAATTGEYYISGQVSRVGVYSLSNRKITLKQAIISAGDLTTPDVGTFITVIRRVAGHETVAVLNAKYTDLFSGQIRDIYLHHDDIVRVLEHPLKFATTQSVPSP